MSQVDIDALQSDTDRMIEQLKHAAKRTMKSRNERRKSAARHTRTLQKGEKMLGRAEEALSKRFTRKRGKKASRAVDRVATSLSPILEEDERRDFVALDNASNRIFNNLQTMVQTLPQQTPMQRILSENLSKKMDRVTANLGLVDIKTGKPKRRRRDPRHEPYRPTPSVVEYIEDAVHGSQHLASGNIASAAARAAALAGPQEMYFQASPDVSPVRPEEEAALLAELELSPIRRGAPASPLLKSPDVSPVRPEEEAALLAELELSPIRRGAQASPQSDSDEESKSRSRSRSPRKGKAKGATRKKRKSPRRRRKTSRSPTPMVPSTWSDEKLAEETAKGFAMAAEADALLRKSPPSLSPSYSPTGDPEMEEEYRKLRADMHIDGGRKRKRTRRKKRRRKKRRTRSKRRKRNKRR